MSLLISLQALTDLFFSFLIKFFGPLQASMETSGHRQALMESSSPLQALMESSDSFSAQTESSVHSQM